MSTLKDVQCSLELQFKLLKFFKFNHSVEWFFIICRLGGFILVALPWLHSTTIENNI